MKNKSSKNDLTIDENLRFRKLEKAFLSRCRHFGYKEIKTSTIEPLYIFTALGALSEEKLRRIYSFIDWDGWSGERVALKPDSTACVARFYGEHLYSQDPRQKLCYVENHFEWADAGDDISERWQFGIENIGCKTTESDIEVIYMACDILREIGFREYYLYLSYPLINQEILHALSTNETKAELLNLMGKRTELHCANYLKNISNNLENPIHEKIRPGFDNFVSVCEKLDALECPYIFDFSFSGNLEYYTGMQFQILARQNRRTGKDILCSGGRYDNFIRDISELSEPVPAVGFALYAKNIISQPAMTEQAGALTERLQHICIYISNITKYNVRTGQILCDKLTRIGFMPKIAFHPVDQERYERFGLVIEVDHERFADGYQVLNSQKIDKPLLMNLFGDLNGR